jgi:hypothetical protein
MIGSGCLASKETRDGADELRERLGTPAWASSVDVDTGLDGQFADFVQVTVKLDGADPAEVTDFVVALPAVATKAGLDNAGLGLRFVSVYGSTLDLDWASDVVPEEVGRGVEEWFSLSAGLGPNADVSLRSDGGASYTVDLGDGDADAIDVAYGFLVVTAEPDTSAEVTATVGDLSLDLSASGPLTYEELDTWDALLDSVGKLPADLPATRLSLHFLDRTVADLVITAPDDTTDDTFTIAAYGDRLWPVVRPQLQALASLPDTWTYGAAWSPSYAPDQDNLFISLLSDQDPIDNGDESTRWSRAAKDYVDSL